MISAQCATPCNWRSQ